MNNGMFPEIMKELKRKTKKKIDWRDLFFYAEKDALDLIQKLLVYNPKERISADEALKHSYFKDFHND